MLWDEKATLGGDTPLPESSGHLSRRSSLTSKTMDDDDPNSKVVVEQAEAAFEQLQRQFTGISQDTHQTIDAEFNGTFDLEAALRGDEEAAREVGILSKRIGVMWDGLTVNGVGGSSNYVQTFAEAFINSINFYPTIKNLLGFVPKFEEVTLLDKFQGVCRPGQMVLVLGKPGSGCTTFLKTIANQRYGYTSITGDVFYGPWTASEFSKYRSEAVYNGEDDIHHPTLTVEQTLDFALNVKMPAKRPGNMSKTEFKKHVIDLLLKMFNIEHTRKTVVGDAYVRGISGGERKRVSIAEMMITNACIFSWDNSSRGLDSSTALDFIKSLRIQTNLYKTTTFVSLYQASENMYSLFDKVMVIDQGRQVYYGPAKHARAYFEGLGFASLPRQTTPDYVVSCTDEFERQYAPGRSHLNAPHSPDTLVEAFQKSRFQGLVDRDVAAFKANLEKEKQIYDDFQVAVKEGKRGASNRSEYQVGFLIQVWALMQRQFALKLQGRFELGFSWARNIGMSIFIATAYIKVNNTSAMAVNKGGLLFWALLYNGFQAFSELASTMLGRAVVNKHKAYAFHRPSALWIGQIFVDQCFAATQILLFSIIVYFITGLVRDAGAFFTFYLMILTGYAATVLCFRIVGCISPDFDYAVRFAVFMILCFMIMSGYLIQYPFEQKWLRWIYWINPLGLTFSSMMQNEFERIDLTCSDESLIPSGPGYTDINHQVCTLAGSKPGTNLVKGSDYIAVSFAYFPGNLWRNWGITIVLFVFFLFLNVLLGEWIQFGMGGNSFKIFAKPDAEREALNKKLSEKLEARRNDKSSENGADLTVASESILTWENLNYDVPVPGGTRRLLDNVFGYVQPGELTALMGASGAGKTTLLDVLASRKNIGVITGDILVDGAAPGKDFQRSTSYAEQLDVHEPTQTVREALRFSADLRQPFETPIAERHAWIEEIITLLELESIADCIIGSPEMGLTVEQRKRVTIGVELAAKPELLLFLDEPTSGLDSQSAFSIIRFLKKLAAAGQAIICTIHQPNATIFQQFDRILLLERGGRVVYFGDIGEDASILRGYLKTYGADAARTDNVAEFMLEAIGAGSSPRIGDRDWADIWQESPEFAQLKQDIVKMKQERSAHARAENPALIKEYASPWTHQMRVVCKRMFLSFWRSPNYLMTRLINHLVMGLLAGLTYLKLDTSRAALQYRVFLAFFISILPYLVSTQVSVMFHIKRIFFYRESSSKMYNPWVFSTAAFLAELPYCFLCVVFFFLPIYYIPGLPFESSRAGFFFFLCIITELYAVAFGQGLAAITPSARISSAVEPFIIALCALFCGVTIPLPQLPAVWRTWLYYIDPYSHLVSAAISTVTHGLKVICKPSELNHFTAPGNQTCGEYMFDFFQRGATGYLVNNDTQNCEFCALSVGDDFSNSLGIRFEDRWRELGVFAAYIGLNLIILFLGSRYINYNRR